MLKLEVENRELLKNDNLDYEEGHSPQENREENKRGKYVVHVRRDTKMLKVFAKFYNRVKHPRATPYMVIVGGTMFILPFVNHEIKTPGVIICLVMGALLFLMGLFRHNLSVSTMKKSPDFKMDEELDYIFGNTGVQTNRNGIVETMGSYKKIYRLWEDEYYFYAGMNEDDLIILPKANFVEGDVSTFRDFILDKSRGTFTWKPSRPDNIVKQKWMFMQMRQRQRREEFEELSRTREEKKKKKK